VATEKRQRQRANRDLKYQQQTKTQRRDTLKRRTLIGVGAVAGLLAAVLLLAWIGGAFSDDDESDTSDTLASTLPDDLTEPTVATPATLASAPEALPNGFQPGTTVCPPEGGVTAPVRAFAAPPSLCIDPAGSYTATFVTSEGDIVVELDTANTPGTVNNFITLARYGYYDDTLIFRADPSIDIIQGGGQANSDSPGYNIPDEGDGFTYEAGQLVMARTAEPNSAGGQWFFVGGPNASNLDAQGTYVVFGQITEGLEIVQDIIASVETNGPPPVDVVVETVTITEAGASTTGTSTPATTPASAATEPTTT
jgi:cyclophilin family peptidyl-prolyl cis-trans isomerase